MVSIAIIGGGAAGMMAAVAAKKKNENCTVMLFEKNHYLGAKVLISGGGRCNVTTGIFDVKELLKNYPRGAKFLMTAMFRLPPEGVMAWFEEHGVPMKIEEDLRVFPKSDQGKDVVGALEREMLRAGVEIFCSASVIRVMKHGEKFRVSLKNERFFLCDAVILTTGGNAYRHTGSTGDGYAFAESLGHTLTQLGPSLNSFVLAEKWVSELAGVSFDKAELKLLGCEAKQVYQRTGAFVFTHKGVSGPAIFALSSFAAYEEISADSRLRLSVDFFPDENPEALQKRFLHLLQSHPKKRVENILDMLLPHSLCGVITVLAEISPIQMASNLEKRHREKILHLLKAFPLTVVGRSSGEEFVTAGGVDLHEVDTNTMESKICSGLYFAGELLDVDGFTGGFNLQASWATGALAGEKAAERRA